MKEDNDIEKLFKEGLGGMSEMPPASVKTNIDNAIGFNRKAPMLYFFAAALLILIIGLFIYKCTGDRVPIYSATDLTGIEENHSLKEIGNYTGNEQNNNSIIEGSQFHDDVEIETIGNNSNTYINSSNSLGVLNSNHRDGISSSKKDNSFIPGNSSNSINSTVLNSQSSNVIQTATEPGILSAKKKDEQKTIYQIQASDSDSLKEPLGEGYSAEVTLPESEIPVSKQAEPGTEVNDDNGILDGKPLVVSDSIEKDIPEVLVPNLPTPLERLKYIGLNVGPDFPIGNTSELNRNIGFEANIYYQQSIAKSFTASAGMGYGLNSLNGQYTYYDTTYMDTSYTVFTYDSMQQVIDSTVFTETIFTVQDSISMQLAKTQQFFIPINIGWMKRLNDNWAVQINLGARPTFNSLRSGSKVDGFGLNKFSMDINLQPNLVYQFNRLEILAGPGFGYSAISKWKNDSPFYKPKEVYWNIRAGVRFKL